MARKKGVHYVNNAQFLEELKNWNDRCKEAEEQGEPTPHVTNYLGECFLKIANGLSYRPNFINDTYKQEMISDGIENCLQYIHNFNPEKSKNPFAYFTQIIYYAFIRRIQKEKKQTHVKNKLIEKQNYDMFTTMEHDDTKYSVQGFDPTIMLPDEDVYKPKKKKNVIGKWMEQEMSEVAKLLRNEFMESGQVTYTTRHRLKEILEDKNKREIFAEVISQEEEDESFDEFMIDLVSAKN